MEEIEQRLAKHRKALKIRLGIFFGYNGKEYRGLQYSDQEGIETVEKQVFKALIDGGFVLPQHMGDVKDVSWSRGARTDKGVHALCNVVALRMNLDEDEFCTPVSEAQIAVYEDLEKRAQEIQNHKKRNKKLQDVINLKSVDKKKNINYKKIVNILNSNIPKDMKVYSVKPVTTGFNVRHAARSRKYEYYIPIKVFQKYSDFKNNKVQNKEEEQQTLARVQELISMYEGTKNFHNFTIKIKPKDPEAMRYILSMKASLCQNPENQETWVRIQLHGASFVYHQIRKMVGMVSLIFQKDLPNQYLEHAFFQNHVSVWLAPAEGLFLNRIMFCGYNKKGDVPAPLLLEDEEEADVEIFRQYLQNEVILNSGNVFDEFINHFMGMTDDQIDKEDNNGQKIEEEGDE